MYFHGAANPFFKANIRIAKSEYRNQQLKSHVYDINIINTLTSYSPLREAGTVGRVSRHRHGCPRSWQVQEIFSVSGSVPTNLPFYVYSRLLFLGITSPIKYRG
jgi:hypothetical protein